MIPVEDMHKVPCVVQYGRYITVQYSIHSMYKVQYTQYVQVQYMYTVLCSPTLGLHDIGACHIQVLGGWVVQYSTVEKITTPELCHHQILPKSPQVFPSLPTATRPTHAVARPDP